MLNRYVFRGMLLDDWKVNTGQTTTAATNRVVIGDGKKNEDSESVFLEVVAFGKTGELLLQNTGKKSVIYGDGRLAQQRYVKKDGTNGVVLKVYIDKVDFEWKAKENKNEDDIPF